MFTGLELHPSWPILHHFPASYKILSPDTPDTPDTRYVLFRLRRFFAFLALTAFSTWPWGFTIILLFVYYYWGLFH